ncbi:putative ribonuclease H-like domain-containing protein [Tanacetum coccineum]
MFDIDYLTDSMNYIPVSLENQANPHAGTSEKTNNAGTSQTPKSNASEEKDEDVELIVVPLAVMILEEIVDSRTSSTKSKKEKILIDPQQEEKVSSTDTLEDNPKIQAFRRELEQIALKHLGTVPENNSTSTPSVNTGSQTVNTGRLDHDDSPMPELEIFHKRILKDCLKLYKMTFFNAMQEELLQFKLQQVWVLVDLPHGMKVIGTKWVYRNKRDERGVVVRNKARLVAQGYTQEEDEDVYVLPTPVFADPYHPKKVYKVVKALYGLHQAPRACCNNTHGDQGPLTKDEEAIDVECTLVQSLIGSPHELNCHSRLDIIYGIPTTSSPPVQSPPPTPTPTPIPATEPVPFEHTFEEPSPVHQHFSPPQEQAHRQMTMDDLLQVVPQLISRIDSLETDLKQTKLTMGNALVKLVKKVKKLEGFLKRRNMVLSDSEEEEPEAQGRKSQDDPLASLEEASLAEAIRLDTLQKEEVAKQVHLDSLLAQRIAEEEELNEQQKKRRAQVQFEAQHYTDEDWDLIRAKIEANAELSK